MSRGPQALRSVPAALLNARDAAKYLGYSEPIFRRLVARGVIPRTVLDEGMSARYSRAALDRVIEERTQR